MPESLRIGKLSLRTNIVPLLFRMSILLALAQALALKHSSLQSVSLHLRFLRLLAVFAVILLLSYFARHRLTHYKRWCLIATKAH
jgi:hypothetical protein